MNVRTELMWVQTSDLIYNDWEDISLTLGTEVQLETYQVMPVVETTSVSFFRFCSFFVERIDHTTL